MDTALKTPSLTLWPGLRLQVRTGFFKPYINAARNILEIWELNKRQSLVAMQHNASIWDTNEKELNTLSILEKISGCL